MGNPNARQLALRDPAAAALMGILGNQEASFGADFGYNFHGDDPYGADFGDDDIWGADFGDDFGADFGAAAVKKPTAQAMAKTYVAAAKKAQNTKKRGSLLEPNRDSHIKVERYSFTISQTISIGTGVVINQTGSPDVDIRPQRFVTNAPTVGFITLTLVKVANVTVTVGPGVEDAFDYSALAVGTSLDLPTLTPANRATVQGTYTGFIPPGFLNAQSFASTFSFKGWASIVA